MRPHHKHRATSASTFATRQDLNYVHGRKRKLLTQDSLEFAFSSVIPCEATALSGSVVTDAAARTVSARLVAGPLEHVRPGRALHERAVGSAPPEVAHAADVLRSVPGADVLPVGVISELLLGVADASIAAVVRANCPLARDAVVVRKAPALSGLAVADALVRAGNIGMRVVSSHYCAYPSVSLWACPGGAVGLFPSRVAINSCVT